MTIHSLGVAPCQAAEPGLPRDFVPRPRLIAWLNHAISDPLTLVCAPAGFGKSTLVSSWLEGLTTGRGGELPPMPGAWLSLDAYDSNIDLFLRYFIAALRTIVPGACAETAAMLTAPQSTAAGGCCRQAQQRDRPAAPSLSSSCWTTTIAFRAQPYTIFSTPWSCIGRGRCTWC